MGVVTIALIGVAVWIGVLVFVLAISKASGHADANEERYLAEGRGGASPAPYSNAAVRDDRKPVDRAELEREAQRLRVELPERPRMRRTRLAGIRRHRS